MFNGGQFAAIILLTKFAPPEILGQFNWSMNTAATVVVFCMLSLRSVHVADSVNRFGFGNFRAARQLGMLIAAGVLVLVVLWHEWPRADWTFVVIFLGVGAAKICDALGEIYWGLCQKSERIDLVAIANGLRGVVLVAAFGVAVPLTWYLVDRAGGVSDARAGRGAAWAVAAYAIGWAFIARLFDARVGRGMAGYEREWSWRGVRRVAGKAFPLGVVTVLIVLTTAIPRWIIKASHGDDGFRYVGIFAALTYIIIAGNLFTVQLGHTAANRLAVYFRDSLPRFLGLLLKLELVAAATGAVMFALAHFFGQWLLGVVYQPEYAAYHAQFKIIVIAQCIMLLSSILGFAATQMQVYWFQAAVWSLMCATAWGVSAWLVPSDPIGGGAYAMIAVAGVQLVLYLFAVAYGVWRRPILLAEMSRAAGADDRAGSA